MAGKKSLQGRFPGFEQCLRMMRKPHDAMTSEDGFFWLLPHAGEYVTELMAEFEREDNAGMRFYLLELIAYSGSPEAVPLLMEQLRSDNESLRHWAVYGLKTINIKEARRALWEARSYTFATEEETQSFQRMLERVRMNKK
ncbi:MAG: HEAT repeat domain-containing protein [Ktedonobacterales bacterium]